jgi:chromosome segregation ATPase
MKTKLNGALIWGCALLLLGGCISTQSITKTFKSDQSENELYAQVPERYRNPVEKAKADQLDAAERLKYADEKLKLAKLKKEMATKQEKLSDYQQELARLTHEETVVALELAQWEAIDKAGLGEKENNIKQIYNLETKKAKLGTSRLTVQKDHDTLQLRIDELAGQIKVQAETVATMQAVLGAGGSPAAEASSATEAAQPAADKAQP